MSLNKFTNNLDSTPLHSSGYAEVAAGGSMGSVSSQSFAQRRQIERNRRAIGGYHTSRVATAHHRSLQYSSMDVAQQRPETAADDTRPGYGAMRSLPRPAVSPRQRFTEPPARSYNPYK
jgi:hypothetical protein